MCIRDRADARLNQALHDAGRIMAEAEKRAEQIGGDAYRALREKEMLEQAAEAMRNVIEGYGDPHGEGESSAVLLKIRAIKKAASVSKGRFAFARIDFICPVSRALSAVCRCVRRRCPR